MRSAAMVLGVIGGCLAVLLGFFSYGYTEMVNRVGEVEGLLHQVNDPTLIRTASFLAPLLAIAGGAMAKMRALWGGLLLLVAAGLVAEYLCTIRKDDDDEQPGGVDPGFGAHSH